MMVAAGALWGGWVLRTRQPELGQQGILADGRVIELVGVSEGVRHSRGHGSRLARWLSGFPGLSGPRWSWLQARVGQYRETRATFGRSHLVLWFEITAGTGTPRVVPRWVDGRDRLPRLLPREADRIPVEFLRWTVTATDGSRHGGAVSMSFPTGTGARRYHPVPIDSFPRRQGEFVVDLGQPLRGRTNECVHVGSFRVRNPRVAGDPTWSDEAVPKGEAAEAPGCILLGIQVGEMGGIAPPGLSEPSDKAVAHRQFPESWLIQEVGYRLGVVGGSGGGGPILFSLRCTSRAMLAEFRITDPSAAVRRWDLNRFELADPVGNVSYALLHDWTATAPGEWRLRCWTLPLWKDDPVWRIRLDLVGIGTVASNRTLRLTGLPFPPPPGSSAVVHETNWLGTGLRVVSLGADDLLAASARLRVPHTHPRLAVEFDGIKRSAVTGHSPEVRWLGARDAAGSDVGTVDLYREEFGDPERWVAGFRGSAFQSEQTNPPTFRLDVTFGFPEERHFEFAVRSSGAGR